MKRAGLLLLIALAGCSSLRQRPEPPAVTLPIPESWPAGDPYLARREAALPALSYRNVFRDARLQGLIERALVNNRDLRIAAANIAAAREQFRITRASRLPQVGVGAGAGVGRAGGGTAGDFSTNIGVSAFEVDLFGRVAALTRAEQNRYFATEAAARATRLALVSDVAGAWLNRAADASLLRLAEETVRSAGESVRLTRARLEGGVAPRTDLRQAEQILEIARADVARQRTLLAQDANLLQLLVGAPVDPASLPGSIEEVVPRVAELPAGLDSRILLRRPDILQAEFQLLAANAEIAAARAALFPTISLTGLFGLASNALTGLFTGGAFNFTTGANLNFPIFDAGARRAGVRLTEAQEAAALASYERAIQTGFREVADALARRGTIGEELRATRAQTEAAADTFRLTEARYRGGIESFLASLDAQRSLYDAQRTLLATQLEQGSNLVDLYRALGGDRLIGTGPVGTTLPDEPPIPTR